MTVGVIYKPPNKTRFLEQIITAFETLGLHNEHYVLGDFNINLTLLMSLKKSWRKD